MAAPENEETKKWWVPTPTTSKNLSSHEIEQTHSPRLRRGLCVFVSRIWYTLSVIHHNTVVHIGGFQAFLEI